LPERFTYVAKPPLSRSWHGYLGEGLQDIVSDPRLYRISLIRLHCSERVADNDQVYCRLAAIWLRIKTYLIAALSLRFREADGTACRSIPLIATSVNSLLTGSIYEWLLDQTDIDLKHVPIAIGRLIQPLVEHYQT